MAGLEGRRLERYELQQFIGRGGMADVYMGHDPRFERTVAIKVFTREDEDLLRRFIREAQLMARLSNPHLMPIYDAGESWLDGMKRYFIVMPYMEGGTLRSLVRRAPLPLPRTCRYLRDIASALDYIHSQGIIHRDIKSSNVLLDAEGRCYLSDFGIARTENEATQATSTGNVLGTVDYVAPELFEPHRRADARSDLYSLGVLLFEMVTGHLPFVADSQIAVVAMHATRQPPSPRSFVPTIPPQVEGVILRALEKRPELRYGSATELAEAFCQAVAGGGTVAQTTSPIWNPNEAPTQLAPQGPLVLPPAPVAAPVRQAPPVRSTGNYGRMQTQYPQRVPPGYQPPPQRNLPSPEQKRGRIVAVIALLTLLAVVGPIAFVLLTHPGQGQIAPSPSPSATGAPSATATVSPTATPNTTATAQAAAATATQQAQSATATAVVAPTVTAQAQASATAGVIQTATAGQPAYADPLTDPNNPATQAAQWDQNDHCAFNSDGYHVTEGLSVVGQGQLQGCLEAGKQFQNAAITVDMNIVSGHTGGVFFCVSPQQLGAYAGYLFETDSQGNYKISRSNNFSLGSDNATLGSGTITTGWKAGNNVQNTIQIVVSNGNLSFYINGAFLTTVQDHAFPAGDIAFLATTTPNNPNATIIYSNLKVFALP
jgi:serine/threonine protein kinase